MAPEAGLFYKSSCLAPALGVTKCMLVTDMILVTLCSAPQVRHRCSTNLPEAGLLNKSSSFRAAYGEAKLVAINLVTLFAVLLTSDLDVQQKSLP
jgi:hypothetical protein